MRNCQNRSSFSLSLFFLIISVVCTSSYQCHNNAILCLQTVHFIGAWKEKMNKRSTQQYDYIWFFTFKVHTGDNFWQMQPIMRTLFCLFEWRNRQARALVNCHLHLIKAMTLADPFDPYLLEDRTRKHSLWLKTVRRRITEDSGDDVKSDHFKP